MCYHVLLTSGAIAPELTWIRSILEAEAIKLYHGILSDL